MRTNIILFAILLISSQLLAQKSYKYVIVPTKNPSIGSGIDPYGISSNAQKILNEKSIKCIFQSAEIPNDYCETVTLNIEKVPNMFRSKLLIELKDCHGRVVWKSEGTGRSKEFREGYAEAFADAVKDLSELPENSTQDTYSRTTSTKPEAVKEVTEAEVPSLPSPSSAKQEIKKDRIYRPGNLYYNYNYFIDVIAKENGEKELLIINGEQLGYDKLDIIGTLLPTGLENVYTINWSTPEGDTLTGVANLSGGELNISLQKGDSKLVINLQKY